MTFHERSLDDMPLAAYSTGVAPDDNDEPDADVAAAFAAAPAPAPTQQDLAAALVNASAAGGAVVAVTARSRLRLPFGLPRLRRSKNAALARAAPFQPVSHPIERPGAFQPVHRPADVPPPAAPPSRLARSPRATLRDPRVLAGGTIVVGLALLAISLLGGGGPATGSGGPGSSQGTTAAEATTAPGNATVELTGGATGSYTLNGAMGGGPAVDSQVDATWTDALGTKLWLSGPASQGTRTTDANFVLRWTMLINHASVTFTSTGSECTIGMAVGPKTVHGTFVCKQLKSDDGKHEIDLKNGKYTT